MSNQNLRAVTTGTAVAKRPDNFPGMLEAYKGEIARALPRHLNADTMARIALTCFRMNAKLAECQPASVFASVIQASQLGLRPGLMGECYLIPYKDQCTLQLGYQGLLELVRRSGLVESIGAYLVHERDVYEVRFGTDPGIRHEPHLDGDPGPVKFGYAIAKLKGGGVHVEVMSLVEIQRIRDRSQNVKNAKRFGKETPWDTDFDEMARKTLIRRICKYLPKSNELALGLALDDAAQRGAQALTVQDAIANTFVPPVVDAETGEIQGEQHQEGAHQDAAAEAQQSEQSQQPAQQPPAKTYAQFVDEIKAAADADAAALVLDQARSTLSKEMSAELRLVYAKTWGDKA